MIVICRGNWAGNIHPPLVLRGTTGPETDTLCAECMAAMRAKIAEREEQKAKVPS